MNTNWKPDFFHFRFIFAQTFFSFECTLQWIWRCFFCSLVPFDVFFLLLSLFKYNGFAVIMNSNHVFDIKAQPMEVELKFILTSKKSTFPKRRAGEHTFLYIHIHLCTLRFKLPCSFSLWHSHPLTSFSLIDWWLQPIKLGEGEKKSAREKGRRRIKNANHNNCSVNLCTHPWTQFALALSLSLCLSASLSSLKKHIGWNLAGRWTASADTRMTLLMVWNLVEFSNQFVTLLFDLG